MHNNKNCNCTDEKRCTCPGCPHAQSGMNKAACCGNSNKHTHEKGKEGIQKSGHEQSKYHHICDDQGCKKQH